ncbi:MAG: hypothetical protein FJW23_01065 [Acidimicrobiia bacterium]|nr:hypothetical protein [Acidimicrobiia bacterium]
MICSRRVAAQTALAVGLIAGLCGSALMAPLAARQDVALAPEPERPATFRAVVTAYSSSPDETWGDPLVTASGRKVFDGLVACPRRFPFGTKFRIGDRVYTCWDRLHHRYDHRFDIWKPSKEDAIQFGLQRLHVEVVEARAEGQRPALREPVSGV